MRAIAVANVQWRRPRRTVTNSMNPITITLFFSLAQHNTLLRHFVERELWKIIAKPYDYGLANADLMRICWPPFESTNTIHSYAYDREQNIIYIFTMGKGHNHHSRITASRCATDFVSSKMDNTMNIIFRDIKIGIFKSSNWFSTKNRRLTGIWLLFFFPFIFWILVVGLIWLSSPQNHALLFCNLHSCCLSGPVCIYMRAAVDTSIVWRSLSSTL